MARWDVAVMAMIGVSATGFLVADGERRRVGWIQAMRRCLLRLYDMIRYERLGLAELLRRIDLHATPQERELTRLLHASAQRMEADGDPRLALSFQRACAGAPGVGVLSGEDRADFEAVLDELGRRGLEEQLRLIDAADERLRQREEALRKETARRAQLIRALSLTGGAAVFLILM